MAMVTLNEEPIEPKSEIFSKDGQSLSNIQTLNVGSPGVGGANVSNGVWDYFDGDGNVVIRIDPNG